jgi:hypothetical protein
MNTSHVGNDCAFDQHLFAFGAFVNHFVLEVRRREAVTEENTSRTPQGLASAISCCEIPFAS